MKSFEKRLSQVERTFAKTLTVTVSFIGWGKGSTEMDLLQAAQLLLDRKIHQISIKMTKEESEATMSETALKVEAYIHERRKSQELHAREEDRSCESSLIVCANCAEVYNDSAVFTQ